MPGHYTQAAPNTPKLVQKFEDLRTKRRVFLSMGLGLLAFLLILALFMPVIGLSLLAFAVAAGIVAYLVWLANRGPRTHWKRTALRR
jgi:small neutral amino acid transporter SnatA (MarC family)